MIPSLYSLSPSYLIHAYDFNNQLQTNKHYINNSNPGFFELHNFISMDLFDIFIYIS